MTPKKPKAFIKPTADALGEVESLVDTAVSFFWSAVRKELSSLDSPSVTVPNLGTFKARYKRIPLLERKYNGYIRKFSSDEMTFDIHASQNTAALKLDKLARLREQMEDEYQRQRETKEKRIAYVNNKSMEK